MIYIYYLDEIPKTSTGNMHGGNAYSKRMVGKLIEAGLKISILIPEGYLPVDEEERILFYNENVVVEERAGLNQEMELEENSILFFPLLKGRNMGLLKTFKDKNKTLKIFITIHGLRLLDLKPDSYDKYYLSGVGYLIYNFSAPLAYLVRSRVYKKVMKKSLRYADKVFTVSNYSMNQITRCMCPGYIKPYYCGININFKKYADQKKDLKYFLFVSAKRAEKNLLRTLEAFIKFKKDTKDMSYFLYAVGLDGTTVKKLKRYSEWDEEMIRTWVKVFDYVDTDELGTLYENANVVLYASKSEGFGLPALEACFSGVPLIAPYNSAVPEVLESSAYYVNPYSVVSICNGLKFMSDEQHQQDYKCRIASYQNIAKLRIEKSDENFIKEFQNENCICSVS